MAAPTGAWMDSLYLRAWRTELRHVVVMAFIWVAPVEGQCHTNLWANPETWLILGC